MKSDRLFRWVNAATREEREMAAEQAGISVRYLIQMGRWLKAGTRHFPHDTAQSLERTIACINANADGGLPPVLWEHLTAPCGCKRCRAAESGTEEWYIR